MSNQERRVSTMTYTDKRATWRDPEPLLTVRCVRTEMPHPCVDVRTYHVEAAKKPTVELLRALLGEYGSVFSGQAMEVVFEEEYAVTCLPTWIDAYGQVVETDEPPVDWAGRRMWPREGVRWRTVVRVTRDSGD